MEGGANGLQQRVDHGVAHVEHVVDVPVLVLRDKTERPQAMDVGTVRLTRAAEDVVVEADRPLTHDAAHAAMAEAVNHYAQGQGTARCAAAIRQSLGVEERLPKFNPPQLLV